MARDCRIWKKPQDMSEARGRNNPTKGGSHIRAAALIPAEHEVKPDEDEDYEIYDWIFRTDEESEPGHCNSSQHPRLGPTLNFPLTVEGIPVSTMVDTGCPTTIISRDLCQKILDGGKTKQSTPDEHRWEVRQRVRRPGLLLRAYCGQELSIGAEMEIQISTQKTEVKAMVLVQGDAAVDMLLGTDLMASLGLCILDVEGQLLLGSASNMHRQF